MPGRQSRLPRGLEDLVGVVLRPALVDLDRAVPVRLLAQPRLNALGRLPLSAQSTVDEHVRAKAPGGHVLPRQTGLEMSELGEPVVVAGAERRLPVADEMDGPHQCEPFVAEPSRPVIAPRIPLILLRTSCTPPATSGIAIRGTPISSGTTSRTPNLPGLRSP